MLCSKTTWKKVEGALKRNWGGENEVEENHYVRLLWTLSRSPVQQRVWDEAPNNIVLSVADMSRGTTLLSSVLRSFRSISFVKTGNTLGNTIETVRPPPEDMADSETLTATFAMSWFWFPEAQFGCANGVVRTKVGYTGGSKLFPTYTSLWVFKLPAKVEPVENIILLFNLFYYFKRNRTVLRENKSRISIIALHNNITRSS